MTSPWDQPTGTPTITIDVHQGKVRRVTGIPRGMRVVIHDWKEDAEDAHGAYRVDAWDSVRERHTRWDPPKNQ